MLAFFKACAQRDKLRRWTLPYMPHFLWLWLAMLPMDEAILDVLEEVIAGLYAHCKDLFIDYVLTLFSCCPQK